MVDQFGNKSSERLVTEGLPTSPEPIEAAQEVQNRSAELEAASLPLAVEAAVGAARAVDELVTLDFDKLEELKQEINDSFSEIANLILDLQAKMLSFEERIERYNARSSHKI